MAHSLSKSYEIDMVNGSILGKMLKFTYPLILSSLLQLAFNAADVIVVGRFAGDKALAAVGSNGSLISLIINVFIGLSVGANVVAAKTRGEKNDMAMSKTVHTAITLALIGGVLLTIIGIAFAKKFLTLMSSPEDVIDLASVYLKIYFCGMIAMLIYNFGSAILRAIGDTRRPLYFLFIAGVINVALNLVFVIVFHMGVAGVALATVISQCVSASLIVLCLIRAEGPIRLDIKKLGIDKAAFSGICKIGLPAGIQGTVFSISNVVIQSSINSFGSIAVAGNSAAVNIEGFVYVVMNAFSQAAVSFTSQNYGAKQYKRIKRITLCSQMCVAVSGIVFGVSAWYFGGNLLSIYTSSKDVIAFGVTRMTYLCLPYFVCGVMDCIVGSLRGIGYSITPMIMSLLGACALRLVWISTVCSLPQCSSIDWVYASYPISWIITYIAQITTYFIGMKKLKKKLAE